MEEINKYTDDDASVKKNCLATTLPGNVYLHLSIFLFCARIRLNDFS